MHIVKFMAVTGHCYQLHDHYAKQRILSQLRSGGSLQLINFSRNEEFTLDLLFVGLEKLLFVGRSYMYMHQTL